MSFLSIFDAVTPVVNKILDFIPDPTQKLEAQKLLLTQIAQSDSEQNATNLAEANNANLFVSGWRPFIGWACGLAFAYHYVVEPFLMFCISCYRGSCVQPAFDMATLSTVLMGMLGLGTLRTVEKMSDKGQLLPWQK